MGLPYGAVFLMGLIAYSGSDKSDDSKDEETIDQKLISAAGWGNLSQVVSLLAYDANVNARSSDGETPLHVAGILCADGVMEALLEARADVNARTNEGQGMAMTPLHWYVNMNTCKVRHVRLLLEARADLSAETTEGQTPVDMVAKLPYRQHIVSLLQDPEGDHVDPASELPEEIEDADEHESTDAATSEESLAEFSLAEVSQEDIERVEEAIEAARQNSSDWSSVLADLADIKNLDRIMSLMDAKYMNKSAWDEL